MGSSGCLAALCILQSPINDLCDSEDLFFLEFPSDHLKTYWCAVVDFWIIWDQLVVVYVPGTDDSLIY